MEIDLSKKEIEALLIILNEQDVCRGGCAYPNNQTNKTNCDTCKFPKLVWSIINKLELI